jgi:hypothetical protein
MLIKPFTGSVNASGQSVVTVSQNLHGIVWKVFQVGFGLGQVASLAQVAVHVNGIPLTPSILMQQSVFSSIVGTAPYAMEAFVVGPPYIILEAGDQMVCGLINGVSGDTFTVGAYVEEHSSNENLTMGS